MKNNSARVLKQKLGRLRKFLAGEPRVLAAFLFGSQADGSATPHSDIDLAVLFDRDLTLDEQLTFEVQVCDTLSMYDDVDIVNLNRASLSFRFRAVAGKMVYQRDFIRVSEFIERTLMERRDFAARRKMRQSDFLAAL